MLRSSNCFPCQRSSFHAEITRPELGHGPWKLGDTSGLIMQLPVSIRVMVSFDVMYLFDGADSGVKQDLSLPFSCRKPHIGIHVHC